MEIGNMNIGNIIDVVDYLVGECAKLPNNPRPESKSGYFTLRSTKDDRPLIKVQIGECPIDKYAKYHFFSWEKSQRLLANMANKNHLSSWQSRVEEEEMYAGAIVADDFILSFSGLPELADEAVMLVTALFLGWANYQEMAAIAKLSNNPFFDELREKAKANSPWKPYIPEK